MAKSSGGSSSSSKSSSSKSSVSSIGNSGIGKSFGGISSVKPMSVAPTKATTPVKTSSATAKAISKIGQGVPTGINSVKPMSVATPATKNTSVKNTSAAAGAGASAGAAGLKIGNTSISYNKAPSVFSNQNIKNGVLGGTVKLQVTDGSGNTKTATKDQAAAIIEAATRKSADKNSSTFGGGMTNSSGNVSNYGTKATSVDQANKSIVKNSNDNMGTQEIKNATIASKKKQEEFDKMADKKEGEGYVFGDKASPEYQATRNKNIAGKVSEALKGKQFAKEEDRQAAIKQAMTDMGIKLGDDKNRQNTVTKISEQVDGESTQGDLMNEDKTKDKIAESFVDSIEAGEDVNDRANFIITDLYSKNAELNNQLQAYKDNATDPETGLLAKNIADRLGDVSKYEAQMKSNNNIIKDTSDRLIRLQSNEAQQGLMRQYLAKGMTEEEARAQSQADMNKQVQLERNTLLQAQKDSAALANQTAQRAAGATDIIRQAKDSNIKYDVGLEQTINQMKQNAESALYTQKLNNFNNFVAAPTMKAYNDMSELEKAEYMAALDINMADKDSRIAVEKIITMLGPDGIKKNAAKVYSAIQGLKNGTMDYATALTQATGAGNATSFQGGNNRPAASQPINSISATNSIPSARGTTTPAVAPVPAGPQFPIGGPQFGYQNYAQ